MASAPCRRPVADNSVATPSLTHDQLATAIFMLCAEGLLEPFEDENGILRYRPVAIATMEGAA